MQVFDIETLGGPIATAFEKMNPPGGGDGLVVAREEGMTWIVVAIGQSSDKYVVQTRRDFDSERVEIRALEFDQYDQFMVHAREIGIAGIGAVFAEDMLDGKTYLVSLTEHGEVHRAVLGNPHECSMHIVEIANFLERVLKLAGGSSS